MIDLLDRLRALSRMEHSDCTIGDEAADALERLTAESRELKTQAMFNKSTIERLTMERDALLEDAERYRWLRNVAQTRDWEYIGTLTAAASDAEIDAARKATP